MMGVLKKHQRGELKDYCGILPDLIPRETRVPRFASYYESPREGRLSHIIEDV